MLVFRVGIRTDSGHFYEMETVYSREDAAAAAERIASDCHLEIVVMECFYILSQTTPSIYRCAIDPPTAGHQTEGEKADRLRAENERLSVGNRRYEIARRLNPAQWAAAFELHIKTDKPFDQIIDEMGPLVSPNA